MSFFEYPMLSEIDLTNFDVDLGIDENDFDALTGYTSMCEEDVGNSFKRKASNLKTTLTKKHKIEDTKTCKFGENHSVMKESPVLMSFLFSSSLPQRPRMESIETFSNDFLYCLNSSDFIGLHYLFNLHMDPSCEISISYTKQKLSCSSFIAYCELLHTAHPDRILIAQKHENKDNKISCDAIVSFTDSLPVYNAIASTVKDPEMQLFFPASRAEILKRRMMVAYRSKPVREQLELLLESTEDLTIFGMTNIVLVTDPVTQKGVSLHIDADFHSVHVANISGKKNKEYYSTNTYVSTV